jgi:prephenate dehydrogenase
MKPKFYKFTSPYRICLDLGCKHKSEGIMAKTKQTCGIIGVGAFGEFMLKHITPYFDVRIYDAHRNLDEVEATYNVAIAALDQVAQCDIVVFAVPVKELEKSVTAVVPYLKPGQLVIDLCSVKCKPVAILKRLIPAGVDTVSLHPLFGPQSGKNGIAGLNITVCNVAGQRVPCIIEFLHHTLNLKTFETTPEHHDQEMAYVQGLTHMIAKVFVRMDVPEIHQQTKTYAHLNDMVELIRYDSEELFLAIQRDNPYVRATTERFFAAVRALEDKLNAAASHQ